MKKVYLPRTYAGYGWMAAIWCLSVLGLPLRTPAQSPLPAPLKRFLEKPALKGASVSLMVKETAGGRELYRFDADRELTPASVLKTVTTASALALLGEDFRYETSLLYDGEIRDGVLDGNLYVYGTGDPTLNSSELHAVKDSLPALWTAAVKTAGIRKITGCVVADESIFDTEGVSMKWMREDMGSYYGAGSYGLNIFDNQYALYLETEGAGATPSISRCEPAMPLLVFHNYLKTAPVSTDSCYITGFPFSNERYLYGVVPARHSRIKLKGDIPDPSLFVAHYFNRYLVRNGIEVQGEPSCYRILSASGRWPSVARKTLVTTYSPALKDLLRITHFASQNLYADALLKTLGGQYLPESQEVLSSFEKGVRVIGNYWRQRGLNTASLWMYDGSGLASSNKVTARFLCDLYVFMATRPEFSDTYLRSLPQAGVEGTVRTMLKGSALEGKARLKSGSMSRVRCYGGYVLKDGKQYAVAILINQFSGKNSLMRADVEELLLSLF
ncbi:MAG: D-alanyl-D-alanine carboxypeptidase/D-alanyl-D-alanine-endopeptidase [Tannerella sp.]|nr:D-alanyl-D-alanine carboxypeptidase/D-alanyl-D-alanine-endopeptidase [Tannerella sp.]